MKKTLWFFVFSSVIFVLIILVNQQMIMHPQKRELQSYHFDWLDHSQKHGMKIKKYSSANNTPYLIVSLPQNYIKSKRQLLLQKQLKGNIKTVPKSVLVLLHGKNGRKEDLLPVAERYISLGFICILPDLPRHGESQINTLYYATIPKEQSYVDEVLKDASKYIKLDNLYIWGMSLGGAFAIQTVAHSKYKFKKMVLVSTFEQLDKVLKDKSSTLFGSIIGGLLYSGLEQSLELFYDFSPSSSNSAKTAKNIDIPIYQIHGEKDKLISAKQGKELFKNFASKQKSFALDADGDHHNILITKYQFFKESSLFLLDLDY